MVLTKICENHYYRVDFTRSEAHVISPPITLNPHITISQSYKRLEFCLTKSCILPQIHIKY